MSKQFISWRRVSTKRQGTSRLGLGAQKTIIDHYVAVEGGELIADYCEVYTGTELSGCTQLRKAIEHCKQTGATLIIAKTDRFRNTIEALEIFDEMKGNIYFCDLPSNEKFMLTLFFALAEREAEIISIRTKAAINEIKDNISKNGGHVSKSGRYITKLGNGGGFDTTGASEAAGMAHTRRASDWRDSSPLYLWVTNQLLKGRRRRDILAEAIELYDKNPAKFGTREGRPLCEGTLSRWANEIRI